MDNSVVTVWAPQPTPVRLSDVTQPVTEVWGSLNGFHVLYTLKTVRSGNRSGVTSAGFGAGSPCAPVLCSTWVPAPHSLPVTAIRCPPTGSGVPVGGRACSRGTEGRADQAVGMRGHRHLQLCGHRYPSKGTGTSQAAWLAVRWCPSGVRVGLGVPSVFRGSPACLTRPRTPLVGRAGGLQEALPPLPGGGQPRPSLKG